VHPAAFAVTLTPPPARAVVIVPDSLGIGALEDAGSYGDEGSNTLGNLGRRVALRIPTLRSLGVGRLVPLWEPGREAVPLGAFGRMAELSPGKDSVTGHWELMGVVRDRPFPTFPGGFPDDLIAAFEARIGRGILGNTVASGTQIIEELGREHVRTGRPIVYTSADSVFQIAAHQDVVPVERLYEWCAAAFDLAVAGMGVGRVIARPFVGEPGHFVRTSNRRDFVMAPPEETALDRIKAAGLPVAGIGKIGDLFAGRGLTRVVHTTGDAHGMDAVEDEMGRMDRGLIFANLVDFDTLYGHRNDVEGYAANLERFDGRLGGLLRLLRPADVLVVAADHGNDPTTPSTDHSREYVPILVAGPRVRPGIDLGTRRTFADLGQTLADLFGAPALPRGTSFLAALTGSSSCS
jgi:phosphopentomutase